jgi:hypothetical protein
MLREKHRSHCRFHGREVLQRVRFPAIGTFDSSRAPTRGKRIATPRTLAQCRVGLPNRAGKSSAMSVSWNYCGDVQAHDFTL